MSTIRMRSHPLKHSKWRNPYFLYIFRLDFIIAHEAKYALLLQYYYSYESSLRTLYHRFAYMEYITTKLIIHFYDISRNYSAEDIQYISKRHVNVHIFSQNIYN